jgi:hypothetical protein
LELLQWPDPLTHITGLVQNVIVADGPGPPRAIVVRLERRGAPRDGIEEAAPRVGRPVKQGGVDRLWLLLGGRLLVGSMCVLVTGGDRPGGDDVGDGVGEEAFLSL